jgi:hypothetical protein
MAKVLIVEDEAMVLVLAESSFRALAMRRSPQRH